MSSVVESEVSVVSRGSISLEARLREAREKREKVLARRAKNDPGGATGPERRGNFEFAPAPFDRAGGGDSNGFPFAGATLPMQEPEPVEPVPEMQEPLVMEAFNHGERPRRAQVVNPKIAEASSGPAESVDSSRWSLDPDDDILINPKIVESMLPVTPYQVSGAEDPWYSEDAKKKLKDKRPRLIPLDPSVFISVDESFDLGTPGELKAVFDEAKYVHARRRTKVRLVRILAILVLVVAGFMVFPVIKGGFQPALEAIFLNAPAD